MVLDLEIVRNVLAVVGGLFGLGTGGFIAVKKARSGADKAASEEWRNVAEAREQRIEELDERVRSMEERIAHLEGAYLALQDLKVAQIADRVVERLVATGLTREGS